MSRAELLELRWPRRFATWALRAGRLRQAVLFVAVAMLFSTASAFVVSRTVRVEDLVFGPTRSPAVDTLVGAIGIERTAVLVYLLERSFDALVIASALTPIFLVLLGSSAMHAAARLRALRGHPYLPLLVLFAYAEVVYQIPTSVAAIVFTGPASAVASAVSLVTLIWFAFVVHRGISLHYAVSGGEAVAIFLIGALVFYLLPLLLIGGTLVAIVVAAAILQYF
jgi:hypothetical protein